MSCSICSAMVEVQTFRARERATGRDVEVHLSASPELLAKFCRPQVSSIAVSMTGKSYVVTAPLGSGFSWRVAYQAGRAKPRRGDFTRMFELRQAPEADRDAGRRRPVQTPVAASPGPANSPERVQETGSGSRGRRPVGTTVPGEPGEFTRMFQQARYPASAQRPASQVLALRRRAGSAPPSRGIHRERHRGHFRDRRVCIGEDAILRL